MSKIDDLIGDEKYEEAVKECFSKNLENLGILLEKILPNLTPNETNLKKVRLSCNWLDSKGLCNLWKKMSKDGRGRWEDLKITSEDDADYYVVINKPHISDEKLIASNLSKTILFRMEPNMEKNKYIWGEYSDPDPNGSKFLFAGYHTKTFNNLEWHLSKTYSQLSDEKIEKKYDNTVLSTVLSEKYTDIGHVKRIDFAKFLETRGINLQVFGSNKFDWKNYAGSLPSHEKDLAIFPYKYTFNVENNFIDNYFTEKIVDAILGECLIFYSGCPNVREYIDPRAFVYLDLNNFEASLFVIQTAMKEDWWSHRIEIIRAEKKRILNELQFFPRISKIIANQSE